MRGKISMHFSIIYQVHKGIKLLFDTRKNMSIGAIRGRNKIIYSTRFVAEYSMRFPGTENEIFTREKKFPR